MQLRRAALTGAPALQGAGRVPSRALARVQPAVALRANVSGRRWKEAGATRQCRGGSVALRALAERAGGSILKSRITQESGQPACEFFDTPLTGYPGVGAEAVDAVNGVNFAVSSSEATGVTLCLFTPEDLRVGITTIEIELDPDMNRTGDCWHCLLPGLRGGMLYGFAMESRIPEGPGNTIDAAKVVLDPYAQGVANSRAAWGQMGPELAYGTEALGLAPTWPQAAAPVPNVGAPEFDWEGDRPLGLPMEETTVYEMHLRGFTQHPTSGVAAPGTFTGAIEKLEHVRRMGFTAVELMPIQEFNELEYYSLIPGSDDEYRYNVWGYSTVAFNAPMARFSDAHAKAPPNADATLTEFKRFVKECHKKGMEVILDVVFNHTAEGNHLGPSLSFRGIDNKVFYMLAPGGEYYNYSGCGNTVNCNHPNTRRFIVDSLRFWVEEMHVDGFRFDLGAILTRAHSTWYPEQVGLSEGDAAVLAEHLPRGFMPDGAGAPTGTPLADPAVVQDISEDPVLRGTKMISEAWDCDGLFQVGAFPHYGGRWSEWNGQFRDTVRNFIKGTDGWSGAMAAAICGSPDKYANDHPGEDFWWGQTTGRKWMGGRGPTASVNFVTAHDGFTMRDLVSYNDKHNEANGEDNKDGESHNASWNCGHEGETDDLRINALRRRQIKNMMCALVLSAGVPMVLMGDECMHTKGGNNNTYCHDTALNWLDWDQARSPEGTGMTRFLTALLTLRKRHKCFRRTHFPSDQDIEWHGIYPFEPDWSESARLLAFTVREGDVKRMFYVAFNTSHEALTVHVPEVDHDYIWEVAVDTSKPLPYDALLPDICEDVGASQVEAARAQAAPWLAEGVYPMLSYSCVVLEAVHKSEAVPSV
ncbi:unnamed protein product [Pedinophyceae sp. YPF-701]|nr:unnamed protein product [Pedinophyceae sp. YPF-701]